MAASALAAPAASAAAPNPHVRITWAEHLTIVEKMAGNVTAVVSLKVNGRRVPVQIVKASFVPQDVSGNPCGNPLVGKISHGTATFTAPHPGASKLRVSTIVRGLRKVAGKYPQAVLVRSAYLGGIFFECAQSSPPAAWVVCDYGTPQPGTIITDAKDCGIPVRDAPFWITKPTLKGSAVSGPRVGLKSGYCWAVVIQHAGPVNWFGGKMSYASAWACSNGIQLLPVVRTWLTAPNDLNGYPECQTRADWAAPWGNYGAPWSFQIPTGLGGRLDVQWSFDVLLPDPLGNKPPIGGEWSSASFYFYGSADGCQQLLAPAAPLR